MNKEIVKKGYEEAQKDLEEKQIKQVKDIVKSTLTKIKDLDAEVDGLKTRIKDLEEKKKILRLDIDDLKDGRLDRIEERQSKDTETKKVSVVIVEKEIHHHHYDRWHEPYKITYLPYYPAVTPVPALTPFYGNTCDIHLCDSVNSTILAMTTGSGCNASFTVNSSLVKNNVIGTYCLDGKTVHLR